MGRVRYAATTSGGRPLRKTWVVYSKNFSVACYTGPAVCTQAEWDEIQAESPDRHTLLRSGFPSEVLAERYARELQIEAVVDPLFAGV